MRRVDLVLDVTGAVGPLLSQGGPIHVGAWVFIPDELRRLDGRPVSVALLHGGTYDKRYFHFDVPGRPGYSAAEHLASSGHIVILTDMLGVGDSSRTTNDMQVTRHVAAAANHAALEQIHERIRSGRLAPGLPAIDNAIRVGGGHSMGGMISIVQQARHRSFDALLVLGFSGAGVHILRNGVMANLPLALDLGQPDYLVMDRALLKPSFQWDDFDGELEAVDNELAVPVPYVLRVEASWPAVVAPECGMIDVPVLVAMGERDVSPAPHAEPAFYTASPDVTLHMVQRAGHCHSFAVTRNRLLDRIAGWISGLSGWDAGFEK